MKISQLMSVSALVLGLSGGAHAATLEAFKDVAFESARAKDVTTILQFHKEGCATCAAQKTALEAAIREESPEKVRAFSVKFDPASEMAKRYGVKTQSTLIVLRGDQVESKSAGITDETKIRELLSHK